MTRINARQKIPRAPCHRRVRGQEVREASSLPQRGQTPIRVTCASVDSFDRKNVRAKIGRHSAARRCCVFGTFGAYKG